MATKTVLLTTGTTWVVPSDLDILTDITVTCIGGGGGGRQSVNNTLSVAGGGGGGGGWSQSSVSLSTLIPGTSVTYINIGAKGTGGTTSGASGTDGGDTWFNKSVNLAPTVNTDGSLAKGGKGSTSTVGGAGGAAGSGIGSVGKLFSGGQGGNGGTGADIGNGGGGGGAAGKDTATGGKGGAGLTTVNDGGAGGGGGVGGAGSDATDINGANGGATYSGGAGGTGGTSAQAGTNGGGGGGGSGRNTNAATAYPGGQGGDGTENSYTVKDGSASSGTAGSGGGGGGGGGTDNTSGASGAIGGAGANAGNYGGGGGGGGGGTTSGNGGDGAQGAIIITYTVLATLSTAYWVNGTGTWTDFTSTPSLNFASSSGGSGYTGYVNGTTNVIFDGNSDTGSGFTVTIGASAVCNDLTISNLDQTMTLSGTELWSVSGNFFNTSTNFVNSFTGTLQFVESPSQTTITSNGISFKSAISFFGEGGVWKLQDNLTTTQYIDLDGGTLDINSKVVSATRFISNSVNSKTLAFGTGKFLLSGTGVGSTAALYMPVVFGLTITGTPIFELTSSATSQSTVATVANNAPFTEGNALNVQFGSSTGTSGIYFTNLPTTVIVNGVYNNIDFTGFTGTLNATTAGRLLWGSLTMSPTMTTAADTQITTFAATSNTNTITSNGITLNFPITFSGAGGTWSLADALILGSTRTLTLTSGTFNANNFEVTAGLFASNNSNTRTLTMGSGLWTLTGVGTVWNLATTTGLTFNKDTANILLSNTSTSARTFAADGLTLNKLTIGGTTGISTTTFTGNGTFSELASIKTVAHTIRFTAGTTSTFGAWTVAGTTGSNVTVTSVTSSTHNLVLLSGIVDVDYLDISYSNASPASSTWYAGTHSVNSGNNTGWIFSAPITVVNGNMILLFF